MKWLEAIVAGVCRALFGWGQDQAEKPGVMKDAKTPDKVRDDLGDSVSDWMRDKDNDRH
jgi:hypothetical protein